MPGFPILASAALKGSVILIAASAAALLLRRRSAAARHLVWTAAAAALLALPLLNVALPSLRVSTRAAAPLAMFHAFSADATSASTPSPTPTPGAVASRRSAATPARDIDFRAWILATCAAGAAFGLL